jgi:hypothetical protein
MKTMLVNKAFNFRIYPTPEQEQILAQLFGASGHGVPQLFRETDRVSQVQEQTGQASIHCAATLSPRRCSRAIDTPQTYAAQDCPTPPN